MHPDLPSPPRPRRPPSSRVHLAGLDALAGVALSARDRRILALALRKLGGAATDFGEAVRAVREAVDELIPAGRIYLLGAADQGPIVGSIVSGVGITEGAQGVLLVRVDGPGRRTVLGSLPR